MGKDYSATDAAFGFLPYGNVLRANIYAVATAPTIGIFKNDWVIHGGTGASTPHFGYLPIIEDSAGPTTSANGLGSVLACFDENYEPVSYIAASEAGNSTIAGYVLVADHPQQMFIVQEDGDGNAIDVAEIGTNVDMIAGTGSSTTGISAHEIDSSSASATEALMFRLIKPHEDDTIADDTDCNPRWIVMPNEHFFGATSTGI